MAAGKIDIMKHLKFAAFTLFLSFAALLPAKLNAQGSLTPPGAPAPTMKSLDQLEPRTAITSLPATISEPGSYYLVTNLTDVILHSYGIIVDADNVTIDLNGFTLSGYGGGVTEHPGITTESPHRNLTVRNGTIRNWGAAGIRSQTCVGCRLENLFVSENGGGGIIAGKATLIRHCIACTNGTDGIDADAGSTIVACVVAANQGVGIYLSAGGVIDDCSASFDYIGIQGAGSTTVRGCSAVANTDVGIWAGTESTVVDCVANTNGYGGYFHEGIRAEAHCTVSHCTAVGNVAEGIYALDGSSVENCTVSLNNSNGITAGIGSTVRNCTARGNGSSGIEVPNDCLVIGNHCTGNGLSTGTGAGIHTTIAGNRIEDNSTIYNHRGLWIEGAANLVIRNSSRYNPNGTGSNNFVIASGNMVCPTNTLASGIITNESSTSPNGINFRTTT